MCITIELISEKYLLSCRDNDAPLNFINSNVVNTYDTQDEKPAADFYLPSHQKVKCHMHTTVDRQRGRY